MIGSVCRPSCLATEARTAIKLYKKHWLTSSMRTPTFRHKHCGINCWLNQKSLLAINGNAPLFGQNVLDTFERKASKQQTFADSKPNQGPIQTPRSLIPDGGTSFSERKNASPRNVRLMRLLLNFCRTQQFELIT